MSSYVGRAPRLNVIRFTSAWSQCNLRRACQSCARVPFLALRTAPYAGIYKEHYSSCATYDRRYIEIDAVDFY